MDDRAALAIATLADSSDLREQLGSAGRARFSALFRHQFMTERVRSVYQQVLTNA